MAEIMCSFDVCLFVGLCVYVRSGPVGLNANSSKTVRATDLKFDKGVPRTVRTWPQIFFQKGAWPGSRNPLNFSALNANAWRRYALSWAPSSLHSVIDCYHTNAVQFLHADSHWLNIILAQRKLFPPTSFFFVVAGACSQLLCEFFSVGNLNTFSSVKQMKITSFSNCFERLSLA